MLLTLGLGGTGAAPGAGPATLNLGVSPRLAGQQFYLQGFRFDPSTPSSFTQTKGLRLRFGV